MPEAVVTVHGDVVLPHQALERLRRDRPGFSYRAFARMAGSTSPNLLKLIVDRKLNISASGVAALSAALELTAKDQAYFEAIVAFDHAKTSGEKDRYLQRILAARSQGPVTELQRERYDFFSQWYIPVIRELMTRSGYDGDPASLAGQTVPPITPGQARKAVKLLQRLGLVRRDPESGRWVQTDKAISTPSEVYSLALAKHTRTIFSMGREAVDRFGPDQRDLRGVTLGISAATYAKVKQRMEAFWNELMALGEGESEVDRVYQVVTGVFPVSQQGKDPQ